MCFCVSRFVACDRNYDWRQRKTHLWRRLLNFRVRMFVKSAVSQMRFLPDICNADIHKPAFSANTYTVVWFLKRELVKTIRWAFWQLFIIPLSLFASQAGDCSVLCALVFDELRPKVMCIHTKLIIVCRRLWAIKKRETPRSLDLLSLLQEQKYWISLDYTISGKQSDLWLVSLDSWRYRIS